MDGILFYQRGDLVAVEQVELAVWFGQIVVDNAVGIAVKRAELAYAG